jgi:hypothetical protein
MIKNVLVTITLLSSCALFFIAGIDALFTSEGPVFLIAVWDEALIVLCICCSFWAFFRTISAVVVMWGAIACRIAVGLLFGLPGYRLHGVLNYAPIPAIFLALAAWLDYRNALRLDRLASNSKLPDSEV